MTEKAFQDHYPNNFAQCYGCGRLNEQGLQIKSYWDGDETVCEYTGADGWGDSAQKAVSLAAEWMEG